MSGDVLGGWGKELWEEVRELVFLAFIPWAEKYLKTDSPWGCSSPGEVTKLRRHLGLHRG